LELEADQWGFKCSDLKNRAIEIDPAGAAVNSRLVFAHFHSRLGPLVTTDTTTILDNPCTFYDQALDDSLSYRTTLQAFILHNL
jgi:hypothetical protein